MEEKDTNYLKQWLSGLPSLPSHYCRSAYKDRKFLYPGTTIAHLHVEYKAAAETAGNRVVCLTKFSEIFHEENYSVFIPRKDQCDVCVSAKHGNIDDATHQAHILAKNQARAEKETDKHAASEEKSVWTMDLQAVLLCPKTKASALYYKTKLQVHNFTLYNLKTKEGYCYIWEEPEGDLSSEVFASLQYSHFDRYIQEHPQVKELIIWSDGCGYQNRNTTISNAYLELARHRHVKIVQKYLVAGHTQMEVDSMHACIERKLVSDIFTPRDYIVIMETSRIQPSPYKVTQVYHTDFLKMTGGYLTSIRPGKKVGDPTVHQLRALEYNLDGQIRYKLEFSPESQWEILPQRIRIPEDPFGWVRLFDRSKPITHRKFNDLQAMKHVLPQHCHHYFDSLPHLEA